MLFPKFRVHLEPQNVTLRGNVQLVKDPEMMSTWTRVGSKPSGWCPCEQMDTGRGHVKTLAEVGGVRPKAEEHRHQTVSHCLRRLGCDTYTFEVRCGGTDEPV